MNGDYIYPVTNEELGQIFNQEHIKFDLIKTQSENTKDWFYQVYYYDVLGNLISIVKYRNIEE